MTDTKQAVRELREALYRGHSSKCPIAERIKKSDCVDLIAKHLPAVLDRLEELERKAEGYRAALWLCAEETAWVRTRQDESFNLICAESVDMGEPKVLIMCSDTFAYACADCEEATYPQAIEVLEIAKAEGWPGITRWVQAQRNGRGEPDTPIAPVAKMMADFDAVRAERDTIRAKFAEFREAIDAQAHEWEHRGIQYGQDLRDILSRFPLDSSETTDGREG